MAWRTIGKAASTVIAGSRVYIKAGLYEETNGVEVANYGIASNPIIFEGYKVTPGDRPTYPTYTPGGALDSTEIPVLQGPGPNVNVDGLYTNGRLVAKNYLTFRNLGVTAFMYGIQLDKSQYVTIIDVFATNCGGSGIYTEQCDHCTIQNVTLADNWMTNMWLSVTHNSTVTNCVSHAVAYDLNAYEVASDYHFMIGDSHNTTISNCVARNHHWAQATTHPGHAFGIKDRWRDGAYANPHSYGNVISNCTAYNMGEHFFIAHEAYNNSIINCKGYANYGQQMDWCQGIDLRDGAHDNIVSGCRMEGSRYALSFDETVEATTSQVCTNNSVVNCIFTDTNIGIGLYYADNNTIRNCVFNNCGHWTFLRLDVPSELAPRTSTGNTCRNTIVSNCDSTSPGYYYYWQMGTSATIPFTYSDFYGNRFSMPAGTGNIAVDPLYADVVNKDFHLKSTGGRWNPATSSWVIDTVTSPCIDAGNPADSYALEPTPNGGRINMGAYGNTAEASKTGRSVVRPPTRSPYVPPRR